MEKYNFDPKEMINSKTNVEGIETLRERFIHDYSRLKNWDPKNLSTDQMLEIVNQKGYKTPGMLNG